MKGFGACNNSCCTFGSEVHKKMPKLEYNT